MRPALLVAVAIALTSAACTEPPQPTPAPTASATPVTTADAEAVRACELAAATPRPGETIELDEQAIKSLIDSATVTSVGPIRKAGDRLRSRYEAWLAAPIGDEAATATDEVLTAAAAVTTACTTAAITG